ncbi:phage tail protein [Avibacterium paragallinarum]|uniref:phage tail-collar fiber domain-containing protein n=1 Tax=Avibacterium paragallinarum TaxID=728 RepID=UPI002ED9A88B
MAKQYYSVLTDYGTQMIASAIARKQPLQITQMAVGDGNGQKTTPNSRNTGLVREVHRANISAISVDPRNNKQLIFELTIPENVGGFWIREMGIFDNQNRLVAYANCPDSFKPELASGSGKVQVVRMILLVSSSDAVTLKVDDSVIFVTRGQLTPKKITATTKNAVDETGHSHEIDKASTTQAGIVQLTNATDSDSETLGLTAKAGKTLKALIDALTRNLNNYIPNSKKSNAINSASSDTVATSNAVKQVSDKIDAFNPISRHYVNLDEQTSPIFYHSPVTSAKPLPTAGDFGGIVVGTNYDATQLLMEAGKIWVRGSDNNPISSPEHWRDWNAVLTDNLKSDALNQNDSNKIATSKAVYDLNDIKLDKVDGEAYLKTIDYTKAKGYQYSGFYRPNTTKVNNLPLGNLMIHIAHPEYAPNAHARGIGFNYGSVKGNAAWDLFTTAFDDNGTYLGQKQIMTELGGKFNGDVTFNTSNSLYVRRLRSTNNNSDWLDYYSAGGHCFYASADNGKKALAINEGKVGVAIDLNLNNNMLAFNDGSSVASSSKTKDSTNVDGIWHDDATNTFHFQSDKPYKTTGDDGNSNLSAANFTASKLVDIKSNIWERIRATLPDGSYWRWEVNPASATDPRFNYVYRSASGEQRYLAFPTLAKNETVAYQSWVIDSTVKKDWLVGVPIPWMLSSVPAGFLAMQGQAFDKSSYPILAQRYPSGRLPDLRGEFIRGWDNGRGVDSGRSLLSNQAGSLLIGADDAFGNGAHDIFSVRNATRSDMQWDAANNNDYPISSGNLGYVIWDNISGYKFITNNNSYRPDSLGFGAARPRNVAFQYICLAA